MSHVPRTQAIALTRAVLTALLVAGPAAAHAETPHSDVLRGRVLDATSSLPVAGARVSIAGETLPVDDLGHFSLRVSPGSFEIEAEAPGYLSHTFAIEVQPVPPPDLEIFLVPKTLLSETVEVTAEQAPLGASSATPVEPEGVLRVAGGGDNIFRLLQTLPGVSGTDGFSSRLSVRGGGPDQNLTVMDGVEIHNPYRLFGLTSAFNPETVERFELTAGGFSARYGDRLSSLLLVENRTGDAKRKLGGSASLSLTDANVITEGRLPGVATGSWLLTLRRTYYDLLAERFFTDDDLPGFGDIQLHASWEPRPGQRLSLLGLRSRENTDADPERDTEGEVVDILSYTRNGMISGTFTSNLGTRGHLRTTAAWTRTHHFLDVKARLQSDFRRSNAPEDEAQGFDHADFDQTLVVRDLSLRQELALRLSSRHLLEAGAELHALKSAVRFDIRGERNPLVANGSSLLGGAGLPDTLDSVRRSTRAGAWVQSRLRISPRVTLEPGLRLDWSGVNRRATLQPRLAATASLGAGDRLRAAVGLYTQSPGYEKLLHADYFLDLTRAESQDLHSERALHVLLGYERALGSGVTARIETYLKRFDRLIVGRLEAEAERAQRLARYDFPTELRSGLPTEPVITSFPTNEGRGRAYGLDLYVSREATAASTRLTGWASYTYGVAEREAYGRTHPFEYDRRHAFSLVARYQPGPKLELSLTGRVASGFPRTPAVGLRNAALPDTLDADTDRNLHELVPERDGEGRLVYQPSFGGVGNLHTARLPPFARVDLRASFRPKGAQGRWEFYVDVINVLNRENPEALNPELQYDPEGDRPRIVEQPGGSIGLLPSLGVRFRF